MTTQPEALRLAEALENTPNWQKEEWNSDWKASVMHFSRVPFEAAAELRRLYALNQELLEALKGAANYIDTMGGASSSYRQLIAKAEGRT